MDLIEYILQLTINLVGFLNIQKYKENMPQKVIKDFIEIKNCNRKVVQKGNPGKFHLHKFIYFQMIKLAKKMMGTFNN